MGFIERQKLYTDVEKITGRPLICYMTSDRPGANGQMAADSVRELTDQLALLPANCTEIDVWINSSGGDGLVSWRMISLIREKIGPSGKIRTLIPSHAFSAATLFALGTDEIFMHPSSCLGPVDPQITVAEGNSHKKFAYEDLIAYGQFVSEDLNVSDDSNKTALFDHLVKEIKPSVIGLGKRSSIQANDMALKLLKHHMVDKDKAAEIATALNKKFNNHGHAVSRSEAIELGLNVSNNDATLADLIWQIFLDFEEEMDMRNPFDVTKVFLNHPSTAPLLIAPPFVNIPSNAPLNVQQQIWQQCLNQIQQQPGNSVDFKLIHAALESGKLGRRFTTEGKILGGRRPDLEFQVSAPALRAGWINA